MKQLNSMPLEIRVAHFCHEECPDLRPMQAALFEAQLRADVVEYCLDGLRRFSALEDKELKAAVCEIAMLGRAGLDTNDPQKKHRLQSLPGVFSGLQLVSLMYTGLRLLNLDASVGMDLSREFEAAMVLFDSSNPR